MQNQRQLRQLFQKIHVIRSPRHRLATFGTSRIHYQLVTEVSDFSDRTRLREGLIVAEKPILITPQNFRDRFEGFSPDAMKQADSLLHHYGEALRGLTYNFKNESLSSRIELTAPEAFASSLARKFDTQDSFNNAIIKGADRWWELSLMKFIVEETLASFATNVQELSERGYFDGEDRVLERQRRDVENLFRVAKMDRSAIPTLGKKLREYGLFETFQDAFFQLVNR